MTFDFYSFRFVFSALDPIVFPPGQPGNILRGAFGNAFRGIVCSAECPGARQCPTKRSPAIMRASLSRFPRARGPSGLRDRPRPFVFRAAYLDGRTIQPEERFWFDVNLFETRDPPLESFALAFGRLAKDGLGPGAWPGGSGVGGAASDIDFARAGHFGGCALCALNS